METVRFFDVDQRRVHALDADIHWDNTDYPNLHDHLAFWEYWIVTDGSCRHTVNGKECVMRKGDGILIRPRDAHFIRADSVFSHINFAVREGTMRDCLSFVSPTLESELLSRQAELFFWLSPAAYDRVIRYATAFVTERAAGSDTSRTARLFCSFLTETLLSSIADATATYPQWICDLIYEIHKPENLSAHAGQIAAKTHYSHQHVLRVFRECTGKSLCAYINGVKLAAAKDLLADKNTTVTEVAARLGFDSVSYFDRLFKSTFGISPKDWKSQS